MPHALMQRGVFFRCRLVQRSLRCSEAVAPSATELQRQRRRTTPTAAATPVQCWTNCGLCTDTEQAVQQVMLAAKLRCSRCLVAVVSNYSATAATAATTQRPTPAGLLPPAQPARQAH
ncbi:MAG: hypothetical protein KME16_28005 [Scytolyngbya sp. HA4215-MV1]|nr:hypothetical protein [Scytolyngbya sp. HA4215-MV1]